MRLFSSLSGTARTLIYIGMAVTVGGVVTALYPQTWWIMLLGLAVIGLLLVSFKLMLTLRDRKRGKETNAKVLSASQGRGGVTEAGDQAALDDLQKKFSRGVDTLDSLGLDLYALPWFVIVGQPASGKTEAIRRCKIPFPPGLTDELQGTGGTVNMDWWFTNDAVILDTAGKMLFQEAGQGTSEEWVRFLKLVRDARPHCPINGMLLVIPADSLISDSPEQLDQNAKTIAAQLNLIQRTLGVRFPVFVLITKCDLITGFREFFDTLDDRRHQQMLGWSNPDPLDTPFDPAKVEAHLTTVRQRLEKRRFALLQDPVSAAGHAERRLDEVDRLYDFPAAMEGVSDPLQRYLEIIFTGSKLAPKPLFLRGIYFTSSIQKGSILDGVLAQAMGVPLDTLTESRPFERVRPLFLRDLFMEKIFAEGGLVTRADNTVKLKSRRRALVLGTIAVGTVMLLGLSWLGFRTFQKSIGDQGEVWTGIADSIVAENEPSLVMETSPGSGVYLYDGDRDPISRNGQTAMDQLPPRTLGLAEQQIDVPFIFRLTSGLNGDLLRDERERAHRTLLTQWIVRPLVGSAAARLTGKPDFAAPQTVSALAQLVRLRTLKAGQDPAGPPVRQSTNSPSRPDSALDLSALLRFSVAGQADTDGPAPLDTRQEQLDQLQRTLDATLVQDPHRQALASGSLDGQIGDPQLTALIERYLEAQTVASADPDGPIQQINTLALELIELEKAEIRLLQVDELLTDAGPDEAMAHWALYSNGDDQSFVACSDRVMLLLKALAENDYDLNDDAAAMFTRAVDDELERIVRQLRPIRDQLPAASMVTDEQLPVGLGQSADAYPATLRKLIDERIDRHRQALLANSAQVQVELDRLLQRYLSQTRSMRLVAGTGPDRPAALLSEMYLTTDRFKPAAPEALPLSGLAAAITEIDDQLDEARRLVRANTRLAEDDDTRFTQAYSHCEAVLTLRARFARTALVELAATGTEDAEAIKQRVRELAAGLEGDVWAPPLIRLSVGYDPELADDDRFTFDPAYHPEGLKRYLGDWSAVLGAMDDQTLEEKFVQPDDVRAALAGVSRQLNPYFREYLEFWTVKAVAAADYKRISDWEAFSRSIGTVRVATVQNGLDRLSKQVADAAAIPAATMRAEDRRALELELTRIEARLTATGQARQNTVGAAGAVLRHWQNVGDLAGEVDRIRRLSPTNFQSQFLADLYAANPDQVPVAFWSAFTLNPLELVADAGSREVRLARANLEEQFLRFPLFNREARDQPMTVQQLRDAEQSIAVLTGGTSSTRYPAGSIGAGGQVAGDSKINAMLERLRGGARPSAGEQQRIERLSQIVGSLAGEDGLNVKVHLPSEAFLAANKPAWARTMQPAFNRYPELKFNDKSYDAALARTPDDFDLSLPDDGITLTFIRQRSQAEGGGNEPVTVDVAFTKPWSAIRAILPSGSEDEVKLDEGVFWVPVRLPAGPGDQNTRYYYMIGLEFDSPLPAPTEWPSR